ncbi:MAG: methylmalonyl-CoA epimerase [Anaerolineaceae bacterium]|nr:methylmalonyl-CoA epimerase [Anaerolineaceae bacterium]
MIRGVHHTCITVSNLERSIAFYRDFLGLELLFTEESERSQDDRSRALGIAGAKVKLAILKAGEARVELIEYVTAGGRPYDRQVNDVGAMHIAFQVENIDEVYRRMVDHGVRFTAPPATIPAGPMAGWRWTYFFDPDGVSLEIIQTA